MKIELKRWHKPFTKIPFFYYPVFYAGNDGLVLKGDSSKILSKFPEGKIKLLFTDPDYSKGNTSGFEILAHQAFRIMADHSVLMTECPHRYLPEMLKVFQDIAIPQGLRWRWLDAFLFVKGHQRRLRMGKRVMFKPILCYQKGPCRIKGFIKDGYDVEPLKRTTHKWQKNLDGYLYYIERHSQKGDIVLDPFAGSGTTAFACRELKRKFIMIDIDRECCKQMAEELSK